MATVGRVTVLGALGGSALQIATANIWLENGNQQGRHPSPVFAISPSCRGGHSRANAIAHLRDVLGKRSYESRARRVEAVSTADMVKYVHDQID